MIQEVRHISWIIVFLLPLHILLHQISDPKEKSGFGPASLSSPPFTSSSASSFPSSFVDRSSFCVSGTVTSGHFKFTAAAAHSGRRQLESGVKPVITTKSTSTDNSNNHQVAIAVSEKLYKWTLSVTDFLKNDSLQRLAAFRSPPPRLSAALTTTTTAASPSSRRRICRRVRPSFLRWSVIRRNRCILTTRRSAWSCFPTTKPATDQ